MKFDPLFVAPLLLYLKLGSTLNCRLNHTAIQYRLCLQIGQHGLLESRIVTCPKNQPCDDPELYPCWSGETTDVEISTRNGVSTTLDEETTVGNNAEQIGSTTAGSAFHAPNRFGYNLVDNSTSSKNGSKFFFSIETTGRVTTVGTSESAEANGSISYTTLVNPTNKDRKVEILRTPIVESTTVLSTHTETYETTDVVTTIAGFVTEEREAKTTSTLEKKGTISFTSTETELNRSIEIVTTVTDPATENHEMESLSTSLSEGTTYGTKTESYRTRKVIITTTNSVTTGTSESNKNTETVTTLLEEITSKSTTPTPQTAIITTPHFPNAHTIISGANIIISTITTIISIILGFILIDFIFW